MGFKTRCRLVSLLALLAALGVATSGMAQQPNLVANPGFETGDFTGYTVTRDPGFGSYLVVSPVAAYTGAEGAAFGNRDLYFDTISQALDTTSATTFTVSFYLEDYIEPVDPGGGGRLGYSYFNVTFGNTTLLNIAPPLGVESNFPLTYTQLIFTGVPGTGGLTTLSFSGGDNNNFFYLDDLSVTAEAVPEPSALCLAGVGLGALGLGAARRRRTI